MTRKKFVPLALAFLTLFFAASGQVQTNRAVLSAGAANAQIRYNQLSAQLKRLAAQRGWPLYKITKNGTRADLDHLDSKGLPVYVAVFNNIVSAQTIGTNQLWPGGNTGLALNGSTADMKGKIALWDGGRVLATHQELVGRVQQVDQPASLSDHSTHVTGTMIATGINPLAKGMAFAAQQIEAYDYNNRLTEIYAAAPNLLVSNHSYGDLAGWQYDDTKSQWDWYGVKGDTVDYKFGYYDSEDQVLDSIAYNAPYFLIVKSVGNNRAYNGPAVGDPYYIMNSNGLFVPAGNRPAGISSNDGYDIIPNGTTGKNTIDVGAVNPIPGGYNSPADVVLSDFSSWGPTDDGRLKPEIVADGVNVLSCNSTANNAYIIFSGTSMSSPAITGSSFLLQEYYHKLHNAYMRSATLKGLLIHTADEAGPADGPDYQYGYGLADLPKAAAVITSNNTDNIIQENVLNSGGNLSVPVIASGKGPLVATICWTDPAGTVDFVNVLNNPARKLVNDLDLRVSGNGNAYAPWILNRLSPFSPATRGDDTLNVVEKVEIPNTVPGQAYNIQITHKGTLKTGSQAYSLIVSGVAGQAYCASNPLSTAGTRIDKVTIGSTSVTNPNSGCTSYTDNTSHTINMEPGQSVPFTINLSSCDATAASRFVKIFVDANNNGTFTDAGETIATSTSIAGGTATYSGTIAIPTTAAVGNTLRLRIVAEETNSADNVLPCGTYPNGETQDFTVMVVNVSKDVSITAITDPLPGSCQVDSQWVTVRIRNSGAVAQSNIPVSLKVSSGSTTLVDVNTVYPKTLGPLSTVNFTIQAPFSMVAGTTYVIQSATALAGDENPANDAISDTIAVNSLSADASGVAEICGSANQIVGLRANKPDSTDAAFWFDSPTATTPIATGSPTTTTDITSNHTYYLGLNEVTGSVGPKDKNVLGSGGYNSAQGNFIRFHNDLPVTITSARLYVGHNGKVDFSVADMISFDSCTGAFQYSPIIDNLVDVYATTPTPTAAATTDGSPLDTGAVYLLNLPVTQPGDHILMAMAQDSAYLFRNSGITSKPYPMGFPGVFTITGDGAVNTNDCADTGFYQKYYYFFYDMRVTVSNCPSPRVAVTATTPVAPVITRVANLLKSNFTTGNQWYFNDTLEPGHTAQTDTLKNPGDYKVAVIDSTGCLIFSDVYHYSPGDDIGLIVGDNPNHGTFTVKFYQEKTANTNLRVLDMNGRVIYKANYPGFQGYFENQIRLGQAAGGMYVLQIEIGGSKYLRKFMVW